MSSDWAIRNPDAFLEVAFERIAAPLRSAGPGARNVQLRSASFRWGRIRHIANGHADRYDAELLAAALNGGLNRKEAETTLRRGIRDGQAEKTQHYVETEPQERTPRLRILRSAINPTDDDPPSFDADAPAKTTPEMARAIWAAADDYLGTPAEAYLRRRGLRPDAIVADVRHARSRDYDYILFPIRDTDGAVQGVQRVAIDATGEPWVYDDGRKRKLTVGLASGGAFVALDSGPDLYICEGAEDALSIAAALLSDGRKGKVCAAIGAPARLLAPGALLVADRDATLPDMELAAKAAQARVCAPPEPHKDANDLLRAGGFATVLAALDGAQEPRPMFAPASDLDGLPVPPREWHVADLIPAKTVTMLGGDGGVGKSLLALQLAVATATGRPWIGRAVDAPGVAMFLSAEDDADELHRRLDDICDAEGTPIAALSRLLIRSLAGENALLAELDRRNNALAETALLADLEAAMQESKPKLIILDTLADLHSGDENVRSHARQFIGILRGLALRHECAVVLLAHPSLSGMSSGSGLSGSTAWNGSVRSRLYFERVTEEGIEADPDVRRLVSKKSNYGRAGDEITLKWVDGAFRPEGPQTGLDRMATSEKARRVFLKCLDRFAAEGRHVSHVPSVTYAPKVFAASPHAEGCTKRALQAAMEELFHAGKIEVGTHGRASKERSHIRRAGPK